MGQGTKVQPPGHNHPARKPIDEATGLVVLDDFERFSQRDDVFSRLNDASAPSARGQPLRHKRPTRPAPPAWLRMRDREAKRLAAGYQNLANSKPSPASNAPSAYPTNTPPPNSRILSCPGCAPRRNPGETKGPFARERVA